MSAPSVSPGVRVPFAELQALLQRILQRHGCAEPVAAALAYKREPGLIVFIGCGHAGVENIIEWAKEVCGDERIHAVIGGLHLKFSGPQRAVALGTYLQEEAVEKLFACHCTGSRKAGLPRQHQIGAGFEHSFSA